MPKPNPFQQLARGIVRDWINDINGHKEEKKIKLGNKSNEARYQKKLAKELNGEREVNTPVGRIDVLTATEIIEVKIAQDWKSAIGQVKSYGRHYPKHSLRIHLFGEIKPSQLVHIKETCLHEGIALTHEPIDHPKR